MGKAAPVQQTPTIHCRAAAADFGCDQVAELRAQCGRAATVGGLASASNWQAISTRVKQLEQDQSALQRRVEGCEQHASQLNPAEVYRRVDAVEAQVNSPP